MRTGNHLFSTAPSANIQRSTFDRSHTVKTTFDAGYLIPMLVDEVLPGDTINLKTTAFARLATPLKPIFDNLYIDTQYFFVPSRLVWDNFKKMMGEQANPGDSIDYLVPQMTAPAGGYAIGSLHDYMGLPTGKVYSHSSLPLRAYNLIYNEWYRDQNLQNSIVVDKGDGPDTYTDYVLKKRGKRHDYFTSALPWPQKGTAVTLPLATSAPVYGTGKTLGITDGTTNFGLRSDGTSGSMKDQSGAYNQNVGSTTNTGSYPAGDKALGVVTSGVSGLFADLTNAAAATVNALRQAFQIQKLFERDARGGSRYVEILKSHYKVTAPDFRVQRPEYLGGGTSFVNVNPIAQTSNSVTTPSVSPQGNLSAIGSAVCNGHGFNKSFTEHGFIIGLISVRADMTYQQGLNKMWSRRTKLDHYWPVLANLGEQTIKNKEIYLDGSANDDLVFGYQERWGDYRYKPSIITGLFRSQGATPLDYWHLGQHFTSLPTLNATFIEENPPIDRIIAVPSEPHFLCDISHKQIQSRPMPLYSVPGMIDHF